MFLSEWREFPSAPCLAGKKELDDSSLLYVVEMARVPDMLPSLFFPSRAKDLSTPQYYRALCFCRVSTAFVNFLFCSGRIRFDVYFSVFFSVSCKGKKSSVFGKGSW